MSQSPRPDTTCSADGCDRLAVTTPRSSAADGVADGRPGELLPLCAEHAADATSASDLPEA